MATSDVSGRSLEGPVLGRNAAKLAPLANAGATSIRADMRDAAAMTAACDGASQVVSTANNVMGSGANSPTKVDLPAYRTLLGALRDAGVARIVHVSALDLRDDDPVDYFRIKHQIDTLIEASGLDYVLVRPAAFMETWVTLLLGDGIRKTNTATLFGDGRRTANFIASDDVAEFVCRIVEDPAARRERIHLGGGWPTPSAKSPPG